MSKIPLLILLAACGGSPEVAQPRPADRDTDEIPNANNTARNKRDADGSTVTPFDQSNAPEDIAITAQIRKEIVGDSSFSLDAQNIKIVTSGGVTVLRGVVRNAGEKERIEQLAKAIPNVRTVDNQLEIKVE